MIPKVQQAPNLINSYDDTEPDIDRFSAAEFRKNQPTWDDFGF